MARQERQESSQTLINPHTADPSGSHLPTPGLRSSHLGFGPHLPEGAALEPLRMAASQTTGTAWPCHPVPPHPLPPMWGNKVFHPRHGQRDGGRAGTVSALLQSWEPLQRYPGRRSRAGAKGPEGTSGHMPRFPRSEDNSQSPGSESIFSPIMAQGKGSGFIATPLTCKIMSG